MKKIVSNRGFTLIEILIALFIFAIMATIVTAGLQAVLRARTHINTNAKRFDKIELAVTLFQRDMIQAINTNTASFSGDTTQVSITRAGFINPEAIEKRSTLQRVQYQWDKQTLLRRSWQTFTPTAKPIDRALITNVTQFKLQYIGSQGNIYNQWPSALAMTVAKDSGEELILPRAIVLTMTIKQWGNLKRVIAIPARGTTQ